MPQVQAVLLKEFPQGLPRESDFTIETLDLPDLKEDEILVRTVYLSVDPYIRGLLKKDAKTLDFPPFNVNDVLKSGGIGKIEKAFSPGWAEGQLVTGTFKWAEYNIFTKEDQKSLQKVDVEGLPESYALGCLGMPGMTAYNGLLEICNPKEGETVVVSAAAGAVGSLVGQIAKIKGCKVVGIVGSDQKCKIIKNLGFDSAINYKTSKNLAEDLKNACPDGIDCYFDNVGGEIFDVVIDLLNINGRVVLCGSISEYNREEESTGPRKNMILIGKSVKMQGFIVFRDFLSKFPEASKQMIDWIKMGKIKYHETITEGGISLVPKAFIQMLCGENIGKSLVKIVEAQIPTE